MKVEGRKGALDPTLGAGTVRPDEAPSSPTAVGGADQVNLSDAARSLARLRTEVGDVRSIDEFKVTQLSALASDGQYRPDFREVARRLLRELLGDLTG